MEEEMDNKLNLLDENNMPITLNVLDIIESDEYKKSFIIYQLEGDDSQIYASILNENDETYSIDTITDEKEIEYITNIIESTIKENGEE